MHSLSLLPIAFLTACTLACSDLSHLKKRAEGGPTFSYTGVSGPVLWNELDVKNTACANGTRQSPINIPLNMTTVSVTEEEVKFPDTLDKVKLMNLGTTIEIVPPEDQNITVKLDGKEYVWRQAHFHTPSEHRIDNEYFPMEMHMVHQNVADENDFAVLGVFFEIEPVCPSGGVLSKINGNLQRVKTTGSEVEFDGLDLRQVNKAVAAAPLFTYEGSLTTPPCSEVVTFFMVKEPLPVSVNQFRAFKKIMKFNSRYTQAEFIGNGEIRPNLLTLSAESQRG